MSYLLADIEVSGGDPYLRGGPYNDLPAALARRKELVDGWAKDRDDSTVNAEEILEGTYIFRVLPPGTKVTKEMLPALLQGQWDAEIDRLTGEYQGYFAYIDPAGKVVRVSGFSDYTAFPNCEVHPLVEVCNRSDGTFV